MYDNRPRSIEKHVNPSKASIGFYNNMIVNDSKTLCDKEGADSLDWSDIMWLVFVRLVRPPAYLL